MCIYNRSGEERCREERMCECIVSVIDRSNQSCDDRIIYQDCTMRGVMSYLPPMPVTASTLDIFVTPTPAIAVNDLLNLATKKTWHYWRDTVLAVQHMPLFLQVRFLDCFRRGKFVPFVEVVLPPLGPIRVRRQESREDENSREWDSKCRRRMAVLSEALVVYNDLVYTQ